MCSTFYRERLGALLGWYSEWTSCEQVITLCYLLSRISSIQAKFLSLFLASHPATVDTRDVEILEQEANSPNFLSGLHREPDEVVLSHLLSHLPLLKVDSHLARREYMNLLPKVLLGSCEHAHYLDQCWQLLCLSVLHPAFPPDDKNSLNYWLIRLREKSRAVEHKQQMMVMGGPVPPHMPPHGGYFPQIQPPLSSPGLPPHSNGPTTGTGNFFPLLNTASLPLSHPPVSPPALDSAQVHPPHLPIQQSDSGIVLTDTGVNLTADYSACSAAPTPIRQNHMLWSPNKQPEGGCQPNTYRMPNGTIPQFNGLPQRPRDTDNKGDPVIRSLSYPLSKNVTNGSSSPPQQPAEFVMHFDSCNSNTNSSSSGEYEFSAKQDAFINAPGMLEVPNWLKVLRLHKYQDIFSHLTYKEMLSLDESKLECENVTTGARHKILQCIQKLTARSHLLNKLDQVITSLSPDSQELIVVISELRSVVISPMPPYRPSSDTSDDIATLKGSRIADATREDTFSPPREFGSTPSLEALSPAEQLALTEPPPPLTGQELVFGDKTRQLLESNVTDVHSDNLPSMIIIVLSKVYTKLVGLVDFEEDSMTLFIQTLQKAISHEAFAEAQKKLFIEWKTQLEQVSLRHHAFRMNKAHVKKADNRMLRTRNSWSAGTQPVTQTTQLNKGMKQWRVPNRPPVSHIPIHNPYIPPAPMPSGVQLPLTSVRSFPSAKYANYFPMKANINKAKSFPTHYPNNTMECFTEQLPPNEENGMMERLKSGLSNNIHPDFNHLQTNDVYIESLCRSMTDHALGDSTPGVANSYTNRNSDASSSYL